MNLEQSINYNDLVKSLFYQQFFVEPEFIIDRSSKRRLKVVNSQEILSSIIEKVENNLHLWDDHKEDTFIDNISKTFHLDNSIVKSKYNNKIANLPEESGEDRALMLMFALSEVVSTFHKGSITKSHSILKNKALSNLDEVKFRNAINILSQRADPDLSLYQNFYILVDYAHIANLEVAKIIIAKTQNKVIKKLLKIKQ